VEKVDLSVEVGGVRFKNPMVVGASDLTGTLWGIRKCAESGVGGLVMKTLSTNPRSRMRALPFACTIERFGKEFATCWGPGIEGFAKAIPEVWLKEVGPEAVKICHDAGVTFVASMAVEVGGGDNQALADLAKRIEDIGPDMIQVTSYYCPNQVAWPPVEEILGLESELVGVIKDAVSVPVGAKMGLEVYPHLYTDRCFGYEKAGASHISIGTIPTGIFVDPESKDFYGVPAITGINIGRTVVPQMCERIITAKQAGVKTSIWSSGGVWQWTDAVSYMLLGADLIEAVSVAIFRGPRVVGQIANQIEAWMIRKGYHSVNEFVGELLPKVVEFDDLPLMGTEEFPHPSPLALTIDYELCNLCGICLDSCIYGGIDRIDKERGEVVQNKELCWGCGFCVCRCPRDAMKLVDKSGVVYWDGHGSAKFWSPSK